MISDLLDRFAEHIRNGPDSQAVWRSAKYTHEEAHLAAEYSSSLSFSASSRLRKSFSRALSSSM